MRKNKIKFDDKKAPQDEFIGTLIALVVVSIVMNGIFNGQWFAILPIVILAIVTLRNLIEYIQDRESRINYIYHTTSNDLWGIWIATIITSIIMVAIFHGSWIGKIPRAVLNIKAVEITITYIATKKQVKENMAENRQQNVHLYGRKMHSTPELRVVQTITEGSYSSSNSQPVSKYCPLCGESQDQDSSFCAYCGAELR